MRSFTLIRRKIRGRENQRVDFPGAAPDFIDSDKLSILKNDIALGIRNHTMLQKFPFFRWPLWITGALRDDSGFLGGGLHSMAGNSSRRDWINFTNMMSKDALRVDPVGMVSPTYDAWSLEIWVQADSKLYRPQERADKVVQTRDVGTSLLSTIWKEKEFELRETVFGAKTFVNEAVVEAECVLSRKAGSVTVLLVLRPYSLVGIGGVNEVEYRKEGGFIRVNGHDRIALDAKPDYVNTGSGARGDIPVLPAGKENYKGSCRYGMASMALAFHVKKGTRNVSARISLSEEKNIGALKSASARMKDEYRDFAALRIKNGFTMAFPVEKLRKWAYGAKISVLSSIPRGSRPGEKAMSMRAARESYYMAAACSRMGYFPECGRIMQPLLEQPPAVKSPPFETLITAAYSMSAAADYFIHSRDMEFLRDKYSPLREISSTLYNGSAGIKSFKSGVMSGKNSIEYNLMGGHHPIDSVLLAFSMRQFSYLARCMGLFGDEIKFTRESDRLEKILLKEMSPLFAGAPSASGDGGTAALADMNEFHAYGIFAGYPFRLGSITMDNLQGIIDWIFYAFHDVPLHIKCMGGWDTLLSIMLANSLLHRRDGRCYKIMEELMEAGGSRYALPDVISPLTGMGVMGDGDSPVAASAFFGFIRNVLFMDSEQRLEVLPLPLPQWFIPGSEIAIQDAPSRFGPISLRVVSSAGEVQFRFTDLPKFVPPEIVLRLPFKAKIKEENDFVLKKESQDTFVINGWPSVVRFLR